MYDLPLCKISSKSERLNFARSGRKSEALGLGVIDGQLDRVRLFKPKMHSTANWWCFIQPKRVRSSSAVLQAVRADDVDNTGECCDK